MVPVLRWAGNNTDLPSNSKIPKTVIVKIVFLKKVFKEYSISFLVVCCLIKFALVVLKWLMFKLCGISLVLKGLSRRIKINLELVDDRNIPSNDFNNRKLQFSSYRELKFAIKKWNFSEIMMCREVTRRKWFPYR